MENMNLKNLIDLHSHSNFSDGTFSPEELVIYGKKKGLKALALTDHDTINGLSDFIKAGEKHNLEVITGTEISANCDNIKGFNNLKAELHILALNFPFPNNYLNDHLLNFQKQRELRNHEMIKNLNNGNIHITMEELKSETYNTNSKTSINNSNEDTQTITRAHFANLLLKKGYIQKYAEAFDYYLSPKEKFYVPKKVPNIVEIIDLIHNSGGVAIWAHPNLIPTDLNNVELLAKELKNIGLDGIEVFHSSYSKTEVYRIGEMAKKLNLISSGGSDFHGNVRPLVDLGSGKGNLKIPYSFLSDIKLKSLTYQI